ncbi:hypothetical protein [Natronospira sp.]|uniref:hypothetical protein n=1 Tax=Natronospira sp. TaxID=2024970 RepID=UPI003872B22F
MRRSILAMLAVAALCVPAAAFPEVSQPETDPSQMHRGHNPGSLRESVVYGLELGIIGVGAVFTGLLAVYLFMVGLRNLLERRRTGASRSQTPGFPAAPQPPEISSEVAHAIALALFMDLRTFDEEEAEEVTIKKLTRPFSPWMDSWKTALMLSNQRMYRK